MYPFRTIINPELYHGHQQDPPFFEGWYYKIINQEESKAFALIPGIAMDEEGQKHSFIQILDGKKCTAKYL